MGDYDDKLIEFESCDVKCPKCGAIWHTSLEVEYCDCLHCGQHLKPKKYLVIESENEVN